MGNSSILNVYYRPVHPPFLLQIIQIIHMIYGFSLAKLVLSIFLYIFLDLQGLFQNSA